MTKWKIEFNENERSNKKQAHAIITTVTTRCKALESKLEQSNEKLKEVTNQLKDLEKSNARLSDAVRGTIQPRSKCKRKAWTECSAQYQRRQKKKVKQDVKTKPVSVKLLNKDTEELMDVDWNEMTESSMPKKDEESC